MAYQRKTRDVWEVQGLYCGEWERLTTEETRSEAVAQKKCYDENEQGVFHRTKKVRERIEV